MHLLHEGIVPAGVERHQPQLLSGTDGAEEGIDRHPGRVVPLRCEHRPDELHLLVHRGLAAVRQRACEAVGEDAAKEESEDPGGAEDNVAGAEDARDRERAHVGTVEDPAARHGLGQRRALANLSEPQREAIELAYFGGFSHSEIAQILGLPMGTVKGRMRLGLEKIRGELAEGLV